MAASDSGVLWVRGTRGRCGEVLRGVCEARTGSGTRLPLSSLGLEPAAEYRLYLSRDRGLSEETINNYAVGTTHFQSSQLKNDQLEFSLSQLRTSLRLFKAMSFSWIPNGEDCCRLLVLALLATSGPDFHRSGHPCPSGCQLDSFHVAEVPACWRGSTDHRPDAIGADRMESVTTRFCCCWLA
jgi:hypothetical protein